MKSLKVCCLVLGMATAGMLAESAIAETISSSSSPPSVKTKQAAAKKAARSRQSAKQKRLAAARAAEEARRQAEAEAKAQREADLAEQERRLKQADALMKAGKPAEAYDLLEPMEFERSGEVRFDYLLGIAALDSGKAAKATLAFERVLAVDPNFAGARLDMARAYYQLGDLVRAKTEFETVLKANPPKAAKATINKYLEAIDAQLHAKDTRLTGYLEGTLGHDSNVNTQSGLPQATAVFNLAGFSFPATFTLDPKLQDWYMGWAGGINVSHPVTENIALYAGADLRQRGNMTHTLYDPLNVSGNAGGIFTLGKQDSLRVGLVDGQYTLGSARYYDDTGINGEWRHVFSPANQMSLFAQQMYYRFVNSARFTGMTAQNFDQTVTGGSWLHVMPDGRSTVFGSLFYGQERDVTGTRSDGTKRFTGLRVGGQAALGDDMELFGNLGWNEGKYSKQNVFQVVRKDVLYDATAGVNWHWAKLWTLRPQLTWTHNQSNTPIYAYDRLDIGVTVRRDFQ